MQPFKYLLSVFMLFFLSSIQAQEAQLERHIVVIIPSYNNKEWYTKNLDSVFCQKYHNYHVIYIDDNSPDGTGDLVESYIIEKEQTNKVILIKNTERKLALANLYYAIHSCEDTDIIITLDGDDWLAHENVLGVINNVYANPDIWVTYGQFKEYPTGKGGFCCAYPQRVIRQCGFRKHLPTPSHLRSFYAGLFKQIKLEDLLYEGQFYPMTWDLAMMIPMLEMAPKHFKFISDILYIYNNANPINDHKVSKQLQRNLHLHIQKQRKYSPIETLFSNIESKIEEVDDL